MSVSTSSNAAVADLQEMDVLRFLFELKREQIDPIRLQQMLIDHQIQNQVRELAKKSNTASDSSQASWLKRFESAPHNNKDIPEPKFVVKYVPGFPTPTTTPEPDDYTKAPMKTITYLDRSQYIKLKDQMPPTPQSNHSDSDIESIADPSALKRLSYASKINSWAGSSIYNNLPELVMTEYDKMLRESHDLKVETIRGLNIEMPVSYDYNPKKSRIRTNYSDPQIADDRTRNNIASRRSRQRKKFQVQMIQYSVDYDLDDNFLLAKQEKWLMGIIANLEQKITAGDKVEDIAELKKLRKRCGFE